MEQIRIRAGHVRWPPHCADCLGHPGGTVRSSRSVVTGAMPLLNVIPNRWNRAAVEFPVCSQHLGAVRLAAILSHRNLTTLFLLIVACLWLLAVITASAMYLFDGAVERAQPLLVTAAFPLLPLGLYSWARARLPVRIVESDEASLTLAFANAMYAGQFRLQNRGIIL